MSKYSIKKVATSLLLVVSVWLCGALVNVLAAPAGDPPPLAMLRSTADRMIGELDKHQGNLKNNDKLMHGIIRRILVPHFDVVSMSRAVVGRTYWQAGSPAVQKQFVDEFTLYVIRTYSGALESYSGEKIKFYPLRNYDATQSRVQINSDILQNNGPPIPVSYRLAKTGGSWAVYDFSVNGISIVQNYRSQFASTLQNGGLQKLVQEIHAHNR